MEYIYMIIRYKVVQDFKRISIAVKTDEQIFVSCVEIRGFVQKTIVYYRVKRGTFALQARLRIKIGWIELNNEIHVSSISHFPTK